MQSSSKIWKIPLQESLCIDKLSWSCCNHPLFQLLSPNWPSLVWPPLAWLPAVLSCRFLLIASAVNSLVTRLHVTLQQTLDTSLPFHK